MPYTYLYYILIFVNFVLLVIVYEALRLFKLRLMSNKFKDKLYGEDPAVYRFL